MLDTKRVEYTSQDSEILPVDIDFVGTIDVCSADDIDSELPVDHGDTAFCTLEVIRT